MNKAAIETGNLSLCTLVIVNGGTSYTIRTSLKWKVSVNSNLRLRSIILLGSLLFTSRLAFAEMDVSSANVLMPACREWTMAMEGAAVFVQTLG